MTPVSQIDLPTDFYLREMFSREELESTFGFRTSVPDARIRDWLNVRVIPVVIGEVEDRTEGDVSFIRLFFFDSIVNATSVDWGEGTRSQWMPYRWKSGKRPFNQAQR